MSCLPAILAGSKRETLFTDEAFSSAGGRRTGSRIDKPSSHSTGRMDSCTSNILLSWLEVDEVAWSLTRLEFAL